MLEWLRDSAYASMQLPVQVGDSAPFGDENAPMITQLPTWLWIDPTVWTPVSLTSDIIFDSFSATVTATPTNITFVGADDAINCGPNLGPAYNFNLPGNAQRSDCTLTYHHSSAVGDWNLASTITWEITYTYNCPQTCGSGTLNDLTITNTRTVRVAELQAILIY